MKKILKFWQVDAFSDRPFSGNPAVTRDSEIDEDVAAIYNAAGICPAGDIDQIFDQYANLDTRTVEGHDVGVYYDVAPRRLTLRPLRS